MQQRHEIQINPLNASLHNGKPLSLILELLPQKECATKQLHPTLDSLCLRGLILYQICLTKVQKVWC